MLGAFRAITSATTRYCSASQESASHDAGTWPEIPGAGSLATERLCFTQLERSASCPTSSQQCDAFDEGGVSTLERLEEGEEEYDGVADEMNPLEPPHTARGYTASAIERPASRW